MTQYMAMLLFERNVLLDYIMDMRFLQYFAARMHGRAFQTKRSYIMYGIFVINYTLLQ